MATRKYNIARDGASPKDVTEAVGSAVSSGTVQVTVDLANGATKREVLRSLAVISQHITEGNWPPAA